VKGRSPDATIIAAWIFLALLLLAWLLLRSSNDAIQPVDSLLIVSLVVQVWLVFRTARGRVK
jgi:hypothetical protein